MTHAQFDKTEWYKGVIANYDDGEWWVRSVNFKERLLGLWPSFLDPEKDEYETLWVRCENVTINQEESIPL
jgi:hypothetical protein